MKKDKRIICSITSLVVGLSVGLVEKSFGLGVIALMTTLTATIMVGIIDETSYE